MGVVQSNRRGGRSTAPVGFDPATATVDGVLAYLAEHPEDRERVVELERAGKNRTTLLAALSA